MSTKNKMELTNTYKTKIRQLGGDRGTLFVHIPKAIADNLDLEKLNDVIVTIQKNEPRLYRCERCQHQFLLELSEDKVCPACNCETIIEVIEK